MNNEKQTALFQWHQQHDAKIVPFAGYAMPVQYPDGIMQEHRWTREHAGLFDVSHMGQILISGENVAEKLEKLLPQDICGLALNQQRYGLLMNTAGGIDDDLMLTRRADDFYVVVNAACKEDDFAKLQTGLPDCSVQWWPERALLALQGPEAVAVLSGLNPTVADLAFMRGGAFTLLDAPCWVSRSGYTGEDGFEISIANEHAAALADALCRDERVRPIGLGARDSLRLEAGLCLYGNDIDAMTSPVAAGLLWAVQKIRRPDGARAGGYPGADVVATHITEGAPRQRVGLQVTGKMPVRAHSPILANGEVVGEITSGGFSPSLNAPVAMGYVDSPFAPVGTTLYTTVRGREIPLTVVKMPFMQKNYAK